MEPEQYPYFNFARLQLASDPTADREAIIDAFLYQPGNLELIKRLSGLAEDINLSSKLHYASAPDSALAAEGREQAEAGSLVPDQEKVVEADEREVSDSAIVASGDVVHQELPVLKPNGRYTFEEWLRYFSEKNATTVLMSDTADEAMAPGLQLEIPLDYVQHLVEKETAYSHGLDEFVAAQKSSRRHSRRREHSTTASSILATETMAKIYEEQRLFARAIETYRALSAKYPEKSASFAARISELEKEL